MTETQNPQAPTITTTDSTATPLRDALVAHTKSLLVDALRSGDPAGDDAWEKGGIERLYVSHPKHRRVSGCVEIDTAGDTLETVRLELSLPPELAAEVIRLVMGVEREDVPVRVPANVTVVNLAKASPAPTREPTMDDLAEMEEEEEEDDAATPPAVDQAFVDISQV